MQWVGSSTSALLALIIKEWRNSSPWASDDVKNKARMSNTKTLTWISKSMIAKVCVIRYRLYRLINRFASYYTSYFYLRRRKNISHFLYEKRNIIYYRLNKTNVGSLFVSHGPHAYNYYHIFNSRWLMLKHDHWRICEFCQQRSFQILTSRAYREHINWKI